MAEVEGMSADKDFGKGDAEWLAQRYSKPVGRVVRAQYDFYVACAKELNRYFVAIGLEPVEIKNLKSWISR